MEPAAPPAANQATTASADFFVVPPVRQTYATGFGARAVPKMKRRRKQWKWRKSALAYLLQRPEPPPPRRATPPPPTPTDVSFLIWPVRQRWSRPFYDFPPTATHFVAAPFDIRDFLGRTRETLRIRAALRAESLGDGPPARAAPKRPRCDPDATDSDDDDERDDTCACCGRSTLTAAGLAMEDVLVCDNRQCEAEVHLCCAGLPAVPDGDWYCPDCAPRPEDKCVLCLASTAANDPNSVLICDECDGDAHLECTGLAAVPGAEEEFTCAICARRAVRRAARAARAAPKRRRRRPRRMIEENRPPAVVGPPVAQPGWPFVVEPDGDLTRVAAALEVWQARLPREATRRRTRGDYPRPQILYKWDATSGEARGWFPGRITRALGAGKEYNFEIDLSPRRRGCPIPKESVSTVDAAGERRDTRLAVDNYGSKWVWIEDKRLPRSDAWLAAEDVDVGDHDAVAAAIERCAGERGGVTTLNLGLVTRGGKDGVGADTARWPYLLRLLLRYFARWAPGDARCSSVYVCFGDGSHDRRTRDLHRDNDNVAPSRLMAVGDFAGGGLRLPARQAAPVDVRQRANLARGGDGGPFFVFDAKHEPHCVEPYTGRRVAVSFYTVKETALLNDDGRACLAHLGFRLQGSVDAPVVTPPVSPQPS